MNGSKVIEILEQSGQTSVDLNWPEMYGHRLIRNVARTSSTLKEVNNNRVIPPPVIFPGFCCHLRSVTLAGSNEFAGTSTSGLPSLS